MTKTGFMVGIGETDSEVLDLMRRCFRSAGCDIVTIGQYLQPTRDHLPVDAVGDAAAVRQFQGGGESIGFGHVESGPLVRSSYHAHDQVLSLASRDPSVDR